MADAPVVKAVKIQARYADMPDDHKRTFVIGRGPEHYRETIIWLREVCCGGETVFNGIPTLNSGKYPFVEIEVVNLQECSVKFIICKRDLYVFAFTSSSTMISGRIKSDKATNSSGVDSEDNIASSSSEVSPKSKRSDEATTSSSSGVDLKGKIASKNNSPSKTWFLFNCGYRIDDWEVLVSYDGKYIGGTPPTDMELQLMSGAVYSFNEVNATQDKAVHACQTFFVNLSEAARFRPVEYMVYNNLARAGSWGAEFVRLEVERLPVIINVEEENRTLVATVSDENDIYSLIREADHVHPYFRDGDWEVYLEKLVHRWGRLSTIWYACYFTGREFFEMEQHLQMLSVLYMRYKKSVRFTVAVLCRPNHKRVLPVLKGGRVSVEQRNDIKDQIERF